MRVDVQTSRHKQQKNGERAKKKTGTFAVGLNKTNGKTSYSKETKILISYIPKSDEEIHPTFNGSSLKKTTTFLSLLSQVIQLSSLSTQISKIYMNL